MAETMRARPTAVVVPVAALAAWLALVVGATHWGQEVVRDHPRMRINAAPFVGLWDRLPVDRLRVPVLFAAVVVVAGPVAMARLRWRGAVLLAALVAVGWLLVLNAVDGPGALRGPLATRYEYVAGVPDVAAAGGAPAYLRTFTARIDRYPTHVRGHPPGAVLALWAAGRVGADPLGAAVALVLLGWAAATAGALVALREVAGEAATRRAALFVALVPGAIWAGSSLDAFFTGVTVCGTAAVVLATGRDGRRSDLLALAGGLVLGTGLLLSYGTLPALLVPVAVAGVRRRFRPLVLAGVGVAAVLLAAAALGFWWVAGLEATRLQYHQGLSRFRPYRYWVVGNLAAVCAAAGSVFAVGLACIGRRLREGALVLGAVAGVVVADVSGLSKGEVERIWLVFVPWLAGAAVFLRDRGPNHLRGWLVVQVIPALVLQLGLRSPW